MWWVMHYWDELFADKYVPQISFGLNTLTSYPDPNPEITSADGWTALSSVDIVWATLIASAGNSSNSVTGNAQMVRFTASTTTNQWAALYRAVFMFDTSSLGASATIESAILSLFGTFKNDPTSNTPDINIYSSAPGSNTDVGAGDYNTLGSTPFGTAITFSGWSSSTYNDFTLNASGISNISKTGISKFGTRNANYDVAAVAPTWATGANTNINGNHADQDGTANDPKLVVNYILPGGTPQSEIIVNNVIIQSQSKVVSY
jgi:hypothetical protein